MSQEMYETHKYWEKENNPTLVLTDCFVWLHQAVKACDKLKYKNYSSDNAKSDHLNENFTIWIIHNSDYQNKMIRKNATNKGQFLFEIMQIKY